MCSYRLDLRKTRLQRKVKLGYIVLLIVDKVTRVTGK